MAGIDQTLNDPNSLTTSPTLVLPPVSPDSMFSQLRSIPIPGKASDYRHFWEEHKIIVPIFEWHGHTFVRISVQGYDTPEDVDTLVSAIAEVQR